MKMSSKSKALLTILFVICFMFILPNVTYAEETDKAIFDPNENVTRQELAVFMARYAKEILGIDTTSTYDITEIADYSDLSTWAIAPMRYIMEKGVITGDMKLGYARILPRNNATRAEAATMLMRFCMKIMNML